MVYFYFVFPYSDDELDIIYTGSEILLKKIISIFESKRIPYKTAIIHGYHIGITGNVKKGRVWLKELKEDG